jgi:hypothetical protein
VRRCLTRDADNNVGCTQQRISQCLSILNLGARLVDAVRLNKLCRGPGLRSIVGGTLAQIIRLSGLHSAFVGDDLATTFGVGTVVIAHSHERVDKTMENQNLHGRPD